jgi:hypothetical protein
MAVTLRNVSIAGATTKSSDLTYAELDNNFVFTQEGADAAAELIHSRHRWFGYITDYLSDADRASLRAGSSVDIASATTKCLAAHAVAMLPPYGTYTFGSKVTVPANKGIFGFNRLSTVITKAFNGDMVDLSATGSFIRGLSLAGAGATYTGKGVLVSTDAAGKQRMEDVSIEDTAGACIEFGHIGAGSQFSARGLYVNRRNSGTGTGNYAIVMASGAQLSAVPRNFDDLQTGGGCSFDFGGCNDVKVNNATIGDIAFTANSRGVKFSNVRLLNQANLTILGSNVGFDSGCDIAPNITFDGVGPYSFSGTCNGTITDSSDNMNNVIEAPSVSYTPTWTASTANPAIGNGTLIGEYTRHGDTITIGISLTVGSTTTFGTGDWRFSVPVTPGLNASVIQVGTCRMLDAGTTRALGAARLQNGGAYIEIEAMASLSLVSPTVPFTWAQNDTLLINLTYQL